MSQPKPIQIVLCFDGTGNTFRADGTETNILKICRMLQRTDEQREFLRFGSLACVNRTDLTFQQLFIISV